MPPLNQNISLKIFGFWKNLNFLTQNGRGQGVVKITDTNFFTYPNAHTNRLSSRPGVGSCRIFSFVRDIRAPKWYIYSIFRAKKRAILSRDISRHEALINFLSAPCERTDDFLPCLLPQIAQIAETRPSKRFLKGEKSFLKSDVLGNSCVRKWSVWWRHKVVMTSLDQLLT